MDPIGRAFRDLLGIVHQRFAAAADEVHFMVAGLPLTCATDERSRLAVRHAATRWTGRRWCGRRTCPCRRPDGQAPP
jgi:hypothetical protein